MSSVADILASRKPRTVRVRFLFDGELADEIERTRRSYVRAAAEQASLTSAEAVETKTKLDELEAQADDATVEFEFQALGRAALDALKAKYPPTDEMWERYRDRVKANPLLSPPEFDPEGMAPALIAAACSAPKMDLEDAQNLWDELSDGEAARLFDGAWSVNMEGSSRPLSRTATSGI